MTAARRALARWMVLAFVPVFIVATPSASSAATRAAVVAEPVEQVAGAVWEFETNDYSYGTILCDGEAAITADGQQAFGRVSYITCESRADVSPGFAQPGEAGGAWTVWVEGDNCGGSASGEFSAHPDDSYSNEVGYTVGGGWTWGPISCDPVCVGLAISGGGNTYSECYPIALDPAVPPAEAVGECANVNGARVEVGANYRAENGNSMPAMWRDYRFYGIETGATSTWYVYAVYGAPFSSWWASLNPYSLVANSHAAGTARSGPSLATGAQMSIQESAQGGYSSVTGPPIGVGMYRLNSHPYGPPNTSGDHAWKHVPQDPWQVNTGSAGLSQPSTCSFYWGAKIAQRPADDFDEPLGPVALAGGGGAPPPPPPPYVPPADDNDACSGFSFTDPATWGGQAWCMVVGLLGQISGLMQSLVAGIAGLAADIVGGILGGLSALFVPDVMPSFSDIPSPLPSGWVPDMPSLGGASCGGLTMPQISLGFNDWTVGPVTFADTCEDPWPLIRTFTYNGTLVMVLVSAVWMAFRAVASGLGMGVPSAGGDDD